MATAGYQDFNLILQSRGIVARNVLDQPPAGSAYFLNMANCEELAENAIGTRLGSNILSTPALPGPVYSLARLTGLNGNAYRYAGANGNLYRRQALTSGPYTQILTGLSGQPFITSVYNPEATSLPYLFLADLNGMYKDDGVFATPQQWGIFQPQYPVQAQAQAPDEIILDNYPGPQTNYVYTGISSGTIGAYVNTTTTAAVAAGVQSVSVAAPKQLGLFQSLTIDSGGSQETVLVIAVTPTGFTADFTKAHASGVAVTNSSLAMTVPASTTATISLGFGGTPIAAWPTTLYPEDYVGIYLYVSDPSQIQKIILSFDCGDGTFQSDYFYRIIGQGPLQTLLDTNTDSSTSAADAVLSETLGLFSSESSGISQLNTGLNQWTGLLMQLSDFAGAGRADFEDQVFNWSNVNGYQITIVTNDNASATVKMSSLVLFGGAGPDSFAGVSYDWVATFYNANDGTESNPSMFMTNVNPPFQTNWVTPRRQPVNLSIQTPKLDPQVTHMRWYQRGGTLGDNQRRIDEIPISGGGVQNYTALWTDAQVQGGDILSLVNDVPVTSTLVNPVNTTLTAAINTLNQVVTITPASMAGISVSQQVDIGNVIATNFEIVIVLSVTGTTFNAFVQNNHAIGETVAATAEYGMPVQIAVQAFGQMYFAGDKNNPSYLYYATKGNPQGVGSANYVPVSTPDDPITAIVATRSNLFVSTVKRWWSIAPGTNAGQAPTVYPTAADRGCVAIQGVCVKGELVLYQAIDGIRVFTGAESQYYTQLVEFIWQGIGPTPIVKADQTMLSQTVMTWWNNMVFIAYVGVDGLRHRLVWHTEYCVPREAEALTKDGWKTYEFLEEGEEVLTYDENTGQMTWAPIEAINTFDYAGEVFSMKGGRNHRKFDVLCTPSHKWVHRTDNKKAGYPERLRLTHEIHASGEIRMSAPLSENETHTMLGERDAAILGWLITDGTISKKRASGNRSAWIYQKSKGKHADTIRGLLGEDCSKESTRFSSYKPDSEQTVFCLSTAATERVLRNCGYNSRNDLPRIAANLNRKSARSMLDAMMLADGHSKRQSTFSQKDRRIIDCFRILAAICGFTTTEYVYKDSANGGVRGIALSDYTHIDCAAMQKEIVRYEGKVWCPTTPTGTWLMRYKGTITITGNSRWRNDDVPALSILLEPEENALLYGDAAGLIHQDRIDQAFDQGIGNGGTVVESPIVMTLQTPFNDQGKPTVQKQYQNFTLDANTNGVPTDCTLIFDDGESSLDLGTVTTTRRDRINLPVNGGLGTPAYKVSLKLTASTTKRIMWYQASLEALALPVTRQSYDTYWTDLGIADDKIAKNLWFDYNATAPIIVTVYYDESVVYQPFVFTLAQFNGVRNTFRQRLPPRKFRLIRVVMDSAGNDFQLWQTCHWDMKPIAQGKGWENIPLLSLEA